ncbi:MAG TPA: extracellular solute-binding protein [Pseudolysinimonas sp.]|nr:extracellular solute-binding protein [Pseudolysinimonas sp.]
MKTAARLGIVAAAVALAVTSCSSTDGGNGGDGGGSLTYVSFGGSLQDAETKAFVEPFAEQSGFDIATDGPTDYAKIRAQVESDNVSWDVVHSDPFFVVANCGTLFQELDPAVVTNLAGIDPALETSACELPHMRYGIILYYDEAKFGDNPPTSWADFFDTSAFPGKRGAWAYSQGGLIEAALLADGVAPGDLYPMDLDRAFTKLDTIKGDLVWTEGPGQVTEQILSGSVDMAIIYSGRAYDAAAEGASWAAAWDAPSIVSYESVAVLKGVKDPEKAQQLLNYFGDPAAQSAFAALIPYSPTATAAEPDLGDLETEYAVTSHDPAGQVLLDQAWWADNFDTANDRWTAWQAG